MLSLRQMLGSLEVFKRHSRWSASEKCITSQRGKLFVGELLEGEIRYWLSSRDAVLLATFHDPVSFFCNVDCIASVPSESLTGFLNSDS